MMTPAGLTPAYVHQTQYRSEGTRSKKRAGDERDSATKREGSLPGPARYPPAFSTVHTDQEPGKGYLHVLDTATEVLENSGTLSTWGTWEQLQRKNAFIYSCTKNGRLIPRQREEKN